MLNTINRLNKALTTIVYPFFSDLNRHLAAEVIPLSNGVPGQETEGLKTVKGVMFTRPHTFVFSHAKMPFLNTGMQSAPAEEEWCEQEASISRPRGVHRPQGQLRERKREHTKKKFNSFH